MEGYMTRMRLSVLLLAGLASVPALGAVPSWVKPMEQSIHRMARRDLPRISHRVFSVTSFGARSGGHTLCTHAIQTTINACEKAGGGEVLIPAGRYLSGPIVLASAMNLHLARGAMLLMTTHFQDYMPHRKIQGRAHPGYQDCISAYHCHDLAITGHGTIDGQGQAWWPLYRKRKGHEHPPRLPHRPMLVRITDCTRLLVADVHLENSPMFHLVPGGCNDVVIRNVIITAPPTAENTDALDPSGHNYYITGCTFDEGDDCIAIKAGARNGTPAHPSCEHFLITHCVFRHGHGMSVGGQTNGCLRYVVVRDCTFDHTHRGIRLKAGPGYGGLTEDLVYENLKMTDVRLPFFINSFYPAKPKVPSQIPALRTRRHLPVWQHVLFRNITAVKAVHAGRISALARLPASDIVFDHVHIKADRGFTIINARAVRFVRSTISAARGPAIMAFSAGIRGINLHTGLPTP